MTVFIIATTRGGVEDTRLEAKEKKNPKPRTDTLEAKDKNARGQGHSHKCSPKKKGHQKSFSGDLQFIGVPRIFDWGRPKRQITCYDVIKIFQKWKFWGDKDIVRWKI